VIVAEMEVGSGTFVAGPPGVTPQVPVPAAMMTAVSAWSGFRSALEPRHWEVNATTNQAGYSYEISGPNGSTVLQAAFARRIELAASTVSASGRYTVFVQANNVATEVAILDAERVTRWTRLLPHNATLAAFAISMHFDPAEECLAISEQRAAGAGPETWYVDLETRQVSQPVPGFVVAWAG
jgi:hypothetical protein